MSAAEIVYSDIKFTKTKENATGFSPSDSTYSEVNIKPKAEPSTKLPDSKQQAESSGGSKVTSERVVIVVLSVLLVAAVVALGFTSHGYMQTNERVQMLTAINQNLTERRCEIKYEKVQMPCRPLTDPCWKCDKGWEKNETQCYYFNNKTYTWTEARAECQRHNGDLVKIDSEEEQAFLQTRLTEVMTASEDKFWIGLTDSVKEGEWLWVDNSLLNRSHSLEFWAPREPDDWKNENPEGEDCARMGEKNGHPKQKQWFDKSCTAKQKSICEKKADSGKPKCV